MELKMVLFLVYICLFCTSCVARNSEKELSKSECIKHDDTVTCSNSNDIPYMTYEDVDIVNFVGNHFTELQPYTFVQRGYDKINSAIILRFNKISYIHPYAFDGITQLTHLDLYGNNLTSFPDHTFYDLSSLKSLNLANNQIKSVDKNILASLSLLNELDLSQNAIIELPSDLLQNNPVLSLNLSYNNIVFNRPGPILDAWILHDLYLRSCNLSVLPKNAFDGLPDLIILDLSMNNLKYISEKLFLPLKRLQHLDINHNLIAHLEPYLCLLSLGSFNYLGNPLDYEKDCGDSIQLVKRLYEVSNNSRYESHVKDGSDSQESSCQRLSSFLIEINSTFPDRLNRLINNVTHAQATSCPHPACPALTTFLFFAILVSPTVGCVIIFGIYLYHVRGVRKLK